MLWRMMKLRKCAPAPSRKRGLVRHTHFAQLDAYEPAPSAIGSDEDFVLWLKLGCPAWMLGDGTGWAG